MAKQAEGYCFTGTYGDVTLYKMEGKYYARSKSSLTGKRVKRDPGFKRTMELAKIFGTANKIASLVYRKLPAEQRGKARRYELVRMARKMLAEGVAHEKVLYILMPKDHVGVGDTIVRSVFTKDISGNNNDVVVSSNRRHSKEEAGFAIREPKNVFWIADSFEDNSSAIVTPRFINKAPPKQDF